MKCLSIIAVSALLSSHAYAVECKEVEYIRRTETSKIDSNNQRIDFLKKQIDREQNTIDKELNPPLLVATEFDHLYIKKENFDSRLPAIIDSTIKLAENSILADNRLKGVLDQLIEQASKLQRPNENNERTKPDQSLSKSLDLVLKTSGLNDFTRMRLEQLSHRIAFLEQSLPNWNEIQKKIIQDHFNNNTSIADGEVEELRKMKESVISDLAHLKAAEQHANALKEKYQNSVNQVSTTINSHNAEIATLAAEIEASKAKLRPLESEHCLIQTITNVVGPAAF
jgi:chromosome segregation ATPase